MVKKIGLVPFFALVFVAVGCSTVEKSDEDTSKNMAGCWYGESYQPALKGMSAWLINRHFDGDFSVEFRTLNSGSLIQFEKGTWSVDSGVYSTITTEVSGRIIEPPYRDEYKVQLLTENEMILLHERMEKQFESERVSCDYDMP